MRTFEYDYRILEYLINKNKNGITTKMEGILLEDIYNHIMSNYKSSTIDELGYEINKKDISDEWLLIMKKNEIKYRYESIDYVNNMREIKHKTFRFLREAIHSIDEIEYDGNYKAEIIGMAYIEELSHLIDTGGTWSTNYKSVMENVKHYVIKITRNKKGDE